MANPLISIIIPVYNGEKFLQRCFKTLKAQEYSKLECIFINNNSTDNSGDIIKDYCKSRYNYHLLQCEEQGVGPARNKGINFSKGEYISFLDVDDEIEPDKHVILLNEFKKNPHIGMSIGLTTKIYQDGRIYNLNLDSLTQKLHKPPWIGLLWLRQFQFNPATCSYLVRSDLIKKNNIKFPDISHGEDVAFNVLVGLSNNVSYVDNIVCIYHRHPKSSISIANQRISSLERYFQFYEHFALPYFYKNKSKKSFDQAYMISEKIAFRMLMKLIHFEKKSQYLKTLEDLERKSLIFKISFRKKIFKLLPFKYANFLNTKLF